MITSIKVFKEVFKPHNLAARQQELREQTIKMLGQEVVDGDLIVEPWVLELNFDKIRIKHIKGDLDIHNLKLNEIPEWISLIKIDGDFDCSINNLLDLKNSPKTLLGSFYCNTNTLTSLKGCTKMIGKSFVCRNNKLTSLEGGPEWVGNDYICSENNLKSVNGIADKINGDFICKNNSIKLFKNDIYSYITKVGGDIILK